MLRQLIDLEPDKQLREQFTNQYLVPNFAAKNNASFLPPNVRGAVAMRPQPVRVPMPMPVAGQVMVAHPGMTPVRALSHPPNNSLACCGTAILRAPKRC